MKVGFQAIPKSLPGGQSTDSVRNAIDTDVRAMVNGGRMNDSLLGMTYLDRFRSFSVEGDRLLLSR